VQTCFVISESLLTSIPFKTALFCSCVLWATSSAEADEQIKKNLIIIPIEFNSANLPIARMTIQNLSSEIMFDTGSSFGVHIPRDLVSKLSGVKIHQGGEKTTDITGKVVTSDALRIPRLVLDGMEFRNVEGTTLNDWGASMGDDENVPKLATVGLGLFKGKAVLIDYSAKTFTIGNDISEISRPMDKWISLPFRQSSEGLVVTVSVDSSYYNLILDTGASISMLMSSKLKVKENLTSCRISLPDANFDDCYTASYKISSLPLNSVGINAIIYEDEGSGSFEFDGLIGNDFFAMFSVLIDFKNSQLFVRPNT